MTTGASPWRDTYRDLLATARRVTRTEDDARDLVQEALAIALGGGEQDWSGAERRAWLRGVVRRQAAFSIRSAQRRRRREQSLTLEPEAGLSRWRWQPEFLASLPRSLRVLAQFASAELCAAEIRWLLRLSDTALRQRLSGLRRALRGHDEPPIVPAAEPSPGFGPQRAAVLAQLRRRGGRAIATADPDGHVLFLRKDAHDSELVGNGEAKEFSCPSPV